jgi:hypothetical protein
MKDKYYTSFLSTTEDVYQETIRNESERTNLWSKLREMWIEHYFEIPEELIEQRTNLLIAVSYTETFQSLLWIEHLVNRGGYKQAIRDLRTALESVIQAYYIDKHYRNLEFQGKLAVLNEMALHHTNHGRKLIKKANPPKQKQLKDLYGELSGFIHTSVEYFHKILSSHDSERSISELLHPKYDAESFNQCCILSKKVIQHIININKQLVKELLTEK